MAKPGRPGVLPFLLLSAALPRIGLFHVRPHPLFFIGLCVWMFLFVCLLFLSVRSLVLFVWLVCLYSIHNGWFVCLIVFSYCVYVLLVCLLLYHKYFVILPSVFLCLFYHVCSWRLFITFVWCVHDVTLSGLFVVI